MTLPPKPVSRAARVSLWRYARLFRQDILSAQPERLYRAWMAEFRTPFFRSFLINQPDLVQLVLKERPEDFPKSERVGEGLRPLLRDAVFLTNGARWKQQRRIIDPAFEGGRLRDSFPAIWAAGDDLIARLSDKAGQTVEIEQEMSHVTADVIFRTLFSLPIENETARAVFEAFQDHQRAQPLLNLAAFVPLPRWVPRLFGRKIRQTAADIRALITDLVAERQQDIADGRAPKDLATQILTTPDPETGEIFDQEDMVDQVAIFFLAGHETSASALAWALYLLATHPEWQDRVAEEARALTPEFASVSSLKATRDVFRETLRLYPPVPMMVRQATRSEVFRNRRVPRGAQIVISPWHLHRQPRLWDAPDAFDPARWQTENGRKCQREAYLPFSAGARVCPGAGFAMLEGPLLLARILRRFQVVQVPGHVPTPVAHLTVRSADGIRLQLVMR